MPVLRLGTCSWKFPSWAGLVYSAAGGIDYLREYAAQYRTVEVDQWFWSLFEGHAPRLPAPRDVEQYRAAVPDDFRFSIKAPNSLTLTHWRPRAKGDPLEPNPHFLSPALYEEFLQALAPLGETAGPIMFQFEYLNRQKLSGQTELLERFGAFLDAVPATPPIALELRNPRWLDTRHFAFVRERSVIPVLLQGYWMPPIWETFAANQDDILAGAAAILRLHGPDREGIEKETGGDWSRLVAPRDDELATISALVGALLDGGLAVWLNANNHYEGCAPLTLRRLEALLDS